MNLSVNMYFKKNPQNISCLIQNGETSENNPIALIPRDRIAKSQGIQSMHWLRGFGLGKDRRSA